MRVWDEDPALDNDEGEPTIHSVSIGGLSFDTTRQTVRKADLSRQNEHIHNIYIYMYINESRKVDRSRPYFQRGSGIECCGL